MFKLKVFILVGLLWSVSMFSHAEVLEYSELEECIEMSYDITHEDAAKQRREQILKQKSLELNDYESRLQGLDWDYDRASDALRSCQIMNTSHCYSEANRVNSLASQYNSNLRRYETLRKRYNQLVDVHDEELKDLRDLIRRSDNKCYGKEFKSRDVYRACDGETAYFCSVLIKR